MLLWRRLLQSSLVLSCTAGLFVFFSNVCLFFFKSAVRIHTAVYVVRFGTSTRMFFFRQNHERNTILHEERCRARAADVYTTRVAIAETCSIGRTRWSKQHESTAVKKCMWTLPSWEVMLYTVRVHQVPLLVRFIFSLGYSTTLKLVLSPGILIMRVKCENNENRQRISSYVRRQHFISVHTDCMD